MAKRKITVTEAARNFSRCVDQVRYKEASFVLTKNKKPVAELTPSTSKVCTGREFLGFLERFELPEEEALAWSRDMREAREKLLPPRDKWESS